jgi:hypothetical protein
LRKDRRIGNFSASFRRLSWFIASQARSGSIECVSAIFKEVTKRHNLFGLM